MLHSYFYARDKNDVDTILRYPWMDYIGTINIKVQKKLLKPWYKKIKITLHDISLSKQEGFKRAHEETLATKIAEVFVRV